MASADRQQSSLVLSILMHGFVWPYISRLRSLPHFSKLVHLTETRLNGQPVGIESLNYENLSNLLRRDRPDLFERHGRKPTRGCLGRRRCQRQLVRSSNW